MSTMNRPIGSMMKSELAILLGCCLICWLGGVPYLGQPLTRLAFALPSGFLLSRAMRKWLKGKRLVFCREQLRWLLEHLLARITAGNTWEKAFAESPAILGKLLGSRSALFVGLQKLEKQLAARMPLDQQLPRLSQCLPCLEARVCFQILPGLRQSGGQISQFIRRQLHMVSERLALQQDLNAANTQRQTEAIILALLPFFLTGLMAASNSLSAAEPSGQSIMTIGLLAAYVLAIAAAVLTLLFLSGGNPARSKPVKLPGRPRTWSRCLKYPSRQLMACYKNMLPESYGSRILSILRDLGQQTSQPDPDGTLDFFEMKIAYMLAAVFPGIILLIAEPAFWFCLPVCPLLLAMLQDQKVFNLARKRQIQYRLDYPLFLNLVESLLQTGLSLHIALNICIETLMPKQPKSEPIIGPALQQDLTGIRNQFQIGLPADLVMEKLLAGCTIPEAQAAMLLMIRYDRNGGSELLNLLQLQAAACWNLHHSTARKQLEQHALLLMLPMMLDLLSVMLTALLPAVASLSII